MTAENCSIEVTLALPAYNEEKTITRVLEASISSLEALKRKWEIIVIDNYSSDATIQVTKEYMQKEPRIRLIVHEENRLYSGSCETALREAKGKYLAIMDSDGQFTASDLPEFIEKLDKGANLVIGWRRNRNDPFIRILMSVVFNLQGTFWLGYPYHDLNCGIRMLDQSMIKATKFDRRINFANPELFVCAKLANLTLAEVPIQHFSRLEGRTSHNFSKIWSLFWEVTRYFMTLRREFRRRKRL